MYQLYHDLDSFMPCHTATNFFSVVHSRSNTLFPARRKIPPLVRATFIWRWGHFFPFPRIYTSGNANISTISLSFSFRSASPVNFGQWRESDQNGSSGEKEEEGKKFWKLHDRVPKDGPTQVSFWRKKARNNSKKFFFFSERKKSSISLGKGCRVRRRNKDTSKRTKRGSKTSSSSSSSLVTLPLCQWGRRRRRKSHAHSPKKYWGKGKWVLHFSFP